MTVQALISDVLQDQGLDGIAVGQLLQGVVQRGLNPLQVMADAMIDPLIYENPNRVIGGSTIVRLVRQIEFALDDIYLGFLPQGCRQALETERMLCLLQASSLGEAIRLSVRFTNAMAPDVGAELSPASGGGLQHACAYRTTVGLDRSIIVWVRFLWIHRFFSWLIGKPVRLRHIFIRSAAPESSNGFDRFSLFGCPIIFNSSIDALIYDANHLTLPLVRRSVQEYQHYYANDPDWFANEIRPPDWSTRTRKTIIDLQRNGIWFPTIEQAARRLSSSPRQLRNYLAQEGANFQQMRTRLRGEAAGAYLLASDLPIQEIGNVLGFSEPGSFSRHFIAWAGISPSDYRAQHINDPRRIVAASALLAERRTLKIVAS